MSREQRGDKLDSALKQSQEALLRCQASLARASKLAGLGCWELDLASGEMTCAEEVVRLYGLEACPAPLSLSDMQNALHPDDRQVLSVALEQLPGSDGMVSLEHRVPTGDEERVIHQLAEVERDQDGRPLRLVGAVREVTGLRRAERKLALLGQVFESTSEGIALSNAAGKIFMVNSAFSQLTGFSAERALGSSLAELNTHPQAAGVHGRIREELAKEGRWQGEIDSRGAEGQDRQHWMAVTALQRPQESATNYVWALRDISEIKRNEEQITYLAYHDALTGLPNRLLFNDRLKVAMAHAQRYNLTLAILFLDLDNFKNINDGLGHGVGDKLLQDLAKRLEDLVRDEDTVARLGGDEFIMLLEGKRDPRYSARVADRILESFKKPFVIEDHDLHVTGSIGITIFPEDGEDSETLVSNADMAMYRAKAQGRNAYTMFTKTMNSKIKKRMELEGALRKAVEQEEFTVFYQPKVELDGGSVVGMEALVRWLRPGQGMVSPGEFIPVAEDTGLIVDIGEWVLAQACRQARSWHEQGFNKLHVSVNLSPRQFQQKDLVPTVRGHLSDTGLPAEFLELEVTESMVMNDVDDAIITLEELAALGVDLSMDDFGVGYSNLYYLKRFPVNTLKIDKSFVQDITNEPDDRSIVDTIINMSRSLKLKVIAEGVETQEQLQFLKDLECDQMQGFLFSRPLPPEDITKLLASQVRLH